MRSEPFYWVSLVPKGAKKVRVDLTQRVLSFDFEDIESKADKLSLTVDNWDLANFDTPVWRKGNIIEIGWGYADGDHAPARQLIIKKVTGSVKLKVEAVSKSFLMDRVTKSKVFENQKRSDVVQTIAEENGFSADSIDIEDTKETMSSITQAKQTDARFLRKLAAREGFEFYVDFDGFHWHSRRIGQKPVRELKWFSDQRGELKSFNIDNDISPIPGGIPGRKTVRGRNPLTKKNFEFVVDYAKDFSPHLAPQAEVTAELLSGLGNMARDVFDTTMEALPSVALRKERGRGQKRKFLTVKMKAAIIGDPLLLAKTVVQISGIGNRLSGNYYVKSVRHKISGNGYTSSLELLRDGHKENRSQESLFTFVPGGRGGVGAPSDGGCTAMLNRVSFLITDLRSVRDAVYIARHKAGAKIHSSFSQFIGTRIRQLEALKPSVTANPNSPPLTNPVLSQIQNLAIEIWNNKFLETKSKSRAEDGAGKGRYGLIRGSAHILAGEADRARRTCRAAAELREAALNAKIAEARAGGKSAEVQRLERQRLTAETRTDKDGNKITVYHDRNGRVRGAGGSF